MGFHEAVFACFQDYFKFSGRARRPEYWWFVLFVLAGDVTCVVLDAVLFGPEKLIGFEGLFNVFTFFPMLAVTWRRMHDIGRPGWHGIMPLPFLILGVAAAADFQQIASISIGIALILGVLVLIWTIQSSQAGANQFGPEMPKY
ncbi:MAG: DUF805 domain-containing protein [Pseudomonadota bacterium]